MSNFVNWFNSIQGTGPVKNQPVAPPVTPSIPAVKTNTPGSDAYGWDPAGDAGNILQGAMNWDIGGHHPIRHGLNILTAGMHGNTNMLDKSVDAHMVPGGEAEWAKKNGLVQGPHGTWNKPGSTAPVPIPDNVKAEWGPAQSIPAWWAGFSAAMTDDVTSPNYKFSSDVIAKEHPEWDPAATFGLGMATDIAVDPMTYLLGPASSGVSAAVRGSIAGARAGVKGVEAAAEAAGTAAKFLPKTAAATKGAITGTYLGDAGATAYRTGRFSKAIKPAGIKQMMQVHDYNALNKLAKTTKIPTEDLLHVVDNPSSAAEVAARLNKEAGDVAASATGKAAKRASKVSYSEESILSAAKSAEEYAKNAGTIFRGEWALKSGKMVSNNAYRGYRGLTVKPETSKGSAEVNAWDAARSSGIDAPSTDRVIPTQDAPPGMTVKPVLDDGSLPTVADRHNTVAMPDHVMFGLTPNMTPAEMQQRALSVLIDTHPGSPLGDVGAHESALAAYDRLFPQNAAYGLPAGVEDAAIVTRAVNPTVYPDPTSEAIALGARLSENGASDLTKLQQLRELNATEFPKGSAEAVAQRAQIMDGVLTTVVGDSKLVEMKMNLGLNADESISKFLFGTNEYIQSLVEGADEVIFAAIKDLAELPLEIPGYTSRARDVVTRWEAAKSPAEQWSIVSTRAQEYKAAMESAGIPLGNDAANNAVHIGEQGFLGDIAAKGKNVKPEDLNDYEAILAQQEKNLAGPADSALSQADAISAETGIEAAKITHPGASVDVFGRIIDNPEVNIQQIIDETITSAEVAAKGERVAVKGLSVDEFKAMREAPQSANSLGHSGADALTDRVQVTKGESAAGARNLLKEPNVPPQLNDIYDHIVGFARVPQDFPDWIQSVIRISESTAAKAALAKDLLQKLSADTILNRELALKYYSENYLRGFTKMEKLTTKEGNTDLTAGVDFLGRVFKDDPSGVKPKAPTKAESQNINELAAARAAEEKSSGAVKVFASAKRRDVRGRQADAVIGKRATAAKAKAGAAAKTDDPILAKQTDGAWLDAEQLTNAFLNGSVSAHATNNVLHAKIVGDGLRNSLRRMLPLVQFKRRNFRTFETKTIFDSDEQLLATAEHIGQNAQMFAEPLLQSIRDSLTAAGKAVNAKNIAEYAKLIRSRMARGEKEFAGIVDSTPVGTYDGYMNHGIAPGDLTEKMVATPWRNIEPLSGILTDALARGGVLTDIITPAKTALWEGIANAVEVSPTGVLRISKSRLTEYLRKAKIETGMSRPSTIAEIKDGSTAGILRNVGTNMEAYNKELGLNVPLSGSATPAETLARTKVEASIARREKEASGFLTDAQRGAQERDINSLVELLKNTEIHVIDSTGKRVALSADRLREYPPEYINLINEAIARGSNDNEAIARLGSGVLVPDYFRSKLPHLEEAMTTAQQLRIRQGEAVNGSVLWHGDAIAETAKTINVPTQLQQTTELLAAQFKKITNNEFRKTVDLAAADAYQATIKTAKESGGIFRQEGMDAAFTRISKHVDESGKFKAGSAEAWQAKVLAMRKLNLQLAQSGVFDITAISKWGGRVKPAGGIDPDHAYISAIHVMDAMSESIPADAMRVMFDTLKIDGHSIPFSVAQEAAVWGMKMGMAGIDTMGRQAWMGDLIIQLLGKTKGGAVIKAAALKGPDTAAGRAVNLLANTLADEKVLLALKDRHVIRGAMAVSTAEARSGAIAKPIMDRLSEVADNMFAHAGDRAGVMDSSIDALRAELRKQGFAKGSLEHVISSKILENHLVDQFSAMEHIVTRVTRRMKSFSFMDESSRLAAVNAERATTIRSLIPSTHEIALEDAARIVSEAGQDEAQLAEAMDAATHIVDRAVETTAATYEELIYGAHQARATSDVREAGRILESIRDVRAEQMHLYAEANAKNDVAAMDEINVRLERLDQEETVADGIYTSLKDGSALPPLDPAFGEQLITETANPADATLSQSVALSNEINKSIGARIMQLFTSAGRAELTPTAGFTRQTYESASKAAETGLEDAFRLAKKLKINDATQKRIVTSLMDAPTPAVRLAFTQSLSPEEFEFAKQVFTHAEHIFDGSALTRAGLTSREINEALSSTTLYGGKNGTLRAFQMPHALNGESLEKAWRNTIGQRLRDSGNPIRKTPEGKLLPSEYDWLKVLKGYNEALHRASIKPAIAADFSARWGHLSVNGMTEADAVAEGWVKIKSVGSLGQHVDAAQYYPRDMVKELAHMEKLYDALMTPSGNKFIHFMDKTHNMLKATITLWSPRNWGVNAMGEFMTNIMAGVYNPKRYSAATKVMKDGGYLDNAFVANRTNTSQKFLGETPQGIEDLGVGKGIKTHIGGKTTTLSHSDAAKLLDQHGIIIQNNTVEDFFYEAGNAVKANNWFTKTTMPFIKANRGLGHAAARRDNVFRIAHAIDIMEKRSFRSVNEMMDVIQREISAYHPTMHHLTGFEQKVMRRVIFFYTWQRGMLSRTMRAVMENPERIVLAAKANFAISGAMGGDPVALGDLTPNDPRLPSWARGQVAGPSWISSSGDVITTSVNNPYLDTLQKTFGGLSYNGSLPPWENALNSMRNTIRMNSTDQLSPFANVADTTLNWVEAQQSGQGAQFSPLDTFQFVQDMTGFAAVSRATGFTPINRYGIGPWNTYGTLMPPRNDIKDMRDFEVTTKKGQINFLTPLRFQVPSEYSAQAKREHTSYNNRLQKFADPTNPDKLDQFWGWWQTNVLGHTLK